MATQTAVNTITWHGIPIDPPGGSGARSLRLTNIRVNASQLGVSSTLVPIQIVAIIGISGSQNIVLNIPQVTVALIQTGLAVTAPTSTSPLNLQQCATPVGDFFGSSASGPSTFMVRAQEGFAGSFKRRVAVPPGTTNIPPGGVNTVGLENIPGYAYSTESGFVPSATTQGIASAPLGLADNATRILIRFSNVSAGTHLIVGTTVALTLTDNMTRSVPLPPSAVGGYTGGFLQLIAGSIDQFGNPASNSPGFANSTMTFTDLSAPFNGGVEIPVVNGSAYALYEVMNADFAAVERANIPVGVSYTANPNQNLPGTGAVTANVSFAPIGPISSAYGSADPALPVPRYGDTSTAHNVFSINSCNPVTALGVNPSSGSGSSQTFQFLASDSSGAADLQTIWMWFTPSFSASTAGSCLLYYNQPSNQINLLNDAGNSWMSTTIGSAGTLQNSQCSVDAATVGTTPNGNNLTVSIPVSFRAAYAGNQQVWMYAAGAAGNSGWQQRGTWTAIAPVAPVVSAVSVTPNTGTGSIQSFQFVSSDTSGAADLQTVWIWFAPAFNAPTTNGCLFYYNRAANVIYLLDDVGSNWMSMALGSFTGTLQNSQCSLDIGHTTTAINDNNLILAIPMSFKAKYAGAQQVWMYASGGVGNSGWQQRGMWTVAAPVLSATSVTPNAGSGASQSFQFLFSDSAGLADSPQVFVWFTTAFSNSSANSCFFKYDWLTNTLSLLNDAGNAWMSATAIISGTLQNSQCSFRTGPSAITASGTNLTLSLPVSFTARYAGNQQVWMYASGGSSNSGWQQRGTWTVPVSIAAAVSAVSVMPNAGSGTSQTFQFLASDSNGATDLQTVWMWVTPSFSGPTAGSCLLYYNRSTNALNLLNDAGNSWMSISAGSTGMLQNSQCSVDASMVAITPSGNNLMVTLPLSFKAFYAGNQQVWMYAAATSANSGWQQKGTWTATAPATPVSVVSVTPSTGSGPSQTFQFVASDTSGATDLKTVWIWITPSFTSSTVNSCLLYYDRASNVLNLLNDAGNSWMSVSGIGQFVLQNTQCSLNVTPMGIATADVDNLTLSLQVSFKAPYAGNQQVWMYAAGNSSNSGWKQMGAWTATGSVVSAVSVTPNSGSGLSQTFQFQFSDSSSATDFQSVWMWFTPSFGSPTAGSCLVYFDQASSQINLLNDAGTAWLSARPVAPLTLQNSQCSLSASGTVITWNGNNLTVSLPMTFKPSYTGLKQLWMYAAGAAGNSAWQQRGSWTAQ